MPNLRVLSSSPPSTLLGTNVPKAMKDRTEEPTVSLASPPKRSIGIPRSPSITSSSSGSIGSPSKKSSPIDMEGPLTVSKTPTKDEWTKCYCQLIGVILHVYKSSECDEIYTDPVTIGSYTIRRTTSVKHTISIINRETNAVFLHLRATDDTTATSWMDALTTNAQPTQHAKKQKVVTHSITSHTTTYVKLPSSPPAKAMHLFLVRHGHYVNAYTKHALDSDQILSHIGKQQAELTGCHLHQLYSTNPSRHDLVLLHSDMERAVETATIIGGFFSDCALASTPLLREGWPGPPAAKPIGQDSSPAVALPLPIDQASEDARLHQAFQTTFALNDLDDDDDNETRYAGATFRMVVCHANLIRYFLCRALGISPVGVWGHFEINHCGITRIDVSSNGTCKILAVNECGHLPSSLVTSSADHL